LTYIDGDQVTDAANHPLLKTAVDVAARVYDSFHSAEPDAFKTAYIIPKSLDEFRERAEKLSKGVTDMTLGTTGVTLLALSTAAAKLGEVKPAYQDRIYKYVDYCREDDLRCAEVITDAKGHRKKRPNKQADPDLYVHVVDRNADGIFITGAKMHISASSIEHELVIMPTKAMYPGEEDYAIACAVPVNARGVSIIDMTYAPRADDVRHYPISGKVNCPEGFVIFDNVFVPNERVFLDGETAHAATLAHSLGLWERAAGLGDAGEHADREVGMAALLAEANGVAEDPRIKDQLATLVVYATMCRAAGEAAMVNATRTADGNLMPSPSLSARSNTSSPSSARGCSIFSTTSPQSTRQRADRRRFRKPGSARRACGDVHRTRLHTGRAAATLPLRARSDSRCVWRLGVRHRATRRRRTTRAAHRDDAPIQHGAREGHRAPRRWHRQVRQEGRRQLAADRALT
jgi:4-hydroxybutyryl-CoA dehydratase/vinylacetyl-CoA-Delta-isomerase